MIKGSCIKGVKRDLMKKIWSHSKFCTKKNPEISRTPSNNNVQLFRIQFDIEN